MTGLNLETFLHLLRADVGAWVTLGLIGVLLALMTWTSWGSRRVLRKCLVLSVAAHIGLALYGSTLPLVMLSMHPKSKARPLPDRIQKIRVVPWSEGTGRGGGLASGRRASDPWDQPRDPLALAESKVEAPRPETPGPLPPVAVEPAQAPEPVVPELEAAAPKAPETPPQQPAAEVAPAPVTAAPSNPGEIAPPVVARAADADPEAGASPLDRLVPPRPSAREAAAPLATGEGQLRPGDLTLTTPAAAAPPLEVRVPAPDALPGAAGLAGAGNRDNDAAEAGPPRAPAEDPEAAGVAGGIARRPVAPPPSSELPATDVRRLLRPRRVAAESAPVPSRRLEEMLGPLALTRATPSGLPRLPEIQGALGGRPLADVPEVYRSRLDPNRTVRAQHAGASAASEQAVERGLAWLARHQDVDGRWDAGIARYNDGTPVKGDDDFTVHCPPGEPCTGECLYWDADTAVTGLALLAFLGSGYTHTDGKYTEIVGRGLEFLVRVQKPDGDLRGGSPAVGMYCHCMATLALCEAYALTGDERLRRPVERGIGFLVRARARDGQAWRYEPRPPIGDTSILGWAVMALKSAREAGIAVPATVSRGVVQWLDRVSSGKERGLACYQPGQPPKPSMTAEAWTCRQFLGVGGPGPRSDEAARNLLENGPDSAGRDAYNLYYWYYGTLAMFQHGGEPWKTWNAQVRDQLVRRQRLDGHFAGSWDADETKEGSTGGRIYSTALATLTLEVYYRFLRLYEAPASPAPAPDPTPAPPPARRFTTTPASRNRS